MHYLGSALLALQSVSPLARTPEERERNAAALRVVRGCIEQALYQLRKEADHD